MKEIGTKLDQTAEQKLGHGNGLATHTLAVSALASGNIPPGIIAIAGDALLIRVGFSDDRQILGVSGTIVELLHIVLKMAGLDLSFELSAMDSLSFLKSFQ